MKKNSLTTALVAGIAGVAGFAGLANAVDLNPDGLGEVLIYPYYTVNKSQDTLLSVVNTADVSKAVKVRILEGRNSREVLDFNLFLSPWDVWTAAITQVGDDPLGGKILTRDNSCTWPVGALKGAGEKFRTSMFDGSVGPKDGAGTGADRTREGYIEIISMADIVPGSPLDKTVIHGASGSPACNGAILASPAAADLDVPTGGLFGSGMVANVPDGTLFAYNADAIDGFSDIVQFTGGQSLDPSLATANSAISTVSGAVAFVFDRGSLINLDYPNGIDAVSAVFTADAIYNEYQVDPALGSNTDWVVNFPTKRFYVDPLMGGLGDPPFVEPFAGGSNVQIGLFMYDQEEDSPTEEACGGFSPPNPGEIDCGTYLPWEVNVISFLDPADPDAGVVSGVLGSDKLVSNLRPFA